MSVYLVLSTCQLPIFLASILFLQVNTFDIQDTKWISQEPSRYLNQIKSNHFYCHITTAQVPWWVKFLWACSRQCRKTTDNLPMDRQCKKNNNNLHMDKEGKKKGQFKKTTTIYIWTTTYILTVHIYRLYRRQCANTLHILSTLSVL